MVSFFTSIVKGIAIGAGAILPGISSGVLCVIFGIYEELVNSILGFFKDMKKNFLFLLPIGIGIFIGVVLFGNLLKYLFLHYEMQTKFAFIGLILGSIPLLFKEAKKENVTYSDVFLRNKKREEKSNNFSSFFCLLLAFTFASYLLYLENHFVVSNSCSSFPTLYLILSGFLMSAGIIIPGVSSTIILTMLGVYSVYLNAISLLNLSILIPMGIGLLLGSALFMILIQFLLKHYHKQTFYAIIGFVLGSVFVLYPGIRFDMTGIFSIILFIISFFIVFSFEKSSHNYPPV